MTTLYTNIGGGGPWACDDTEAACDGFFVDGSLVLSAPGGFGPTVDGIQVIVDIHANRGGLVRGHDFHLVRTRDSQRSSI